MTLANPLRHGLAIAITAGGLAAQVATSTSNLLAVSHGFSVDGTSAIPNADASTLLFKRSDFSTAPPDDWTPTPLMPDFSTMLDGLPLDVDALSVGLDYIQSDPTGIAVVPPGNWAGITFSVTRTTGGVSGGAIADEVATGGAAADVFFYVLPGSALPAPLVDRTMRNQDSTEINTDVPGSPGDIDAHDVYLGLVYFENPQLGPLLPFRSVWFSVTNASVATVPVAWWGAAPPSGATILRRDWVNGAWGTPYPAFTPTMLGITAGEDVDAVAVDAVRGHVLFSTTRPAATPGAPLRDPILYHRIGTPGNATYRTSTTAPVSERIGLDVIGGIDDVDGICALDPGPGAQPRMDRVYGTPTAPLVPGVPQQLGAAVYRQRAPSGGAEQLVSYVTGWPVPHQPTPGFATLLIGIGFATGPYVSYGTWGRPSVTSPYAVFQGHPERAVVTVPNNPSLFGLPVYFTWAAYDGQALDVSYPTQIVL